MVPNSTLPRMWAHTNSLNPFVRSNNNSADRNMTHLPQQGQNRSDDRTSLSSPGAQKIDQYVQLLNAAIQQKHLQSFYPPGDRRMQQIAERAAKQIDKLAKAWCIPREIAVDIIR